ncbi:MAG: hypothetical protein LBB36_06710, partial [Fibromonadaceae bacterium]|nr:hypothetical protein [Fibromonadaceae bacterium]
MKAFAKILGLVAICSVSLFAQCVEWTSSTIRACNGYDYELWSQNNAGTVKMTITGDNGSGANAKGGTFTSTWKNTQNVLFRSGKKWG